MTETRIKPTVSEIISAHCCVHFRIRCICAGDLPLPLPFVEEITASEITSVFSRMTNQRAAVPDGLHAELLKYGAEYLSPLIANIIITSIETSRNASQVTGVGTMAPISKPGKPRGPVTSLRPIVLLNAIRKALFIVIVKRITPAVEPYMDPTQSGFLRGRSTADVAWTQRRMSAKALRHEWKDHMLSIDMSRAFDTIDRRRILTVRGNIASPDEMLMHLLLLLDTSLVVLVGRATTNPFSNTTGTPQGDRLSPVLFTGYLAAELKDTKHRHPTLPRQMYIFLTTLSVGMMSISTVPDRNGCRTHSLSSQKHSKYGHEWLIH